MSGNFNETKCSRWIERGIIWPGPRATQIVLGYRGAGGEEGGSRATIGVDNWPFPEEQVAVDVMDLVNKIAEASQDFADGSGEGFHRFVLEMWHGEANGKGTPWTVVYAFTRMGRATEGAELQAELAGGGGMTDPTTKAGFAAQQMRHNEQLHTRLIQKDEYMMRFMAAHVAQVTHQNIQLQQRYWEAISAHETMLDQRQERELRNLAAANKMSRFNRLWEVLYTVLPIIATKVLGRPELAMMLPKQVQEGGPVMTMVQQIIGGLEEDQIGALMGVLKPEQIAAFTELHGMILEMQAKKAEAEQAARHITATSKDDLPQEEQRPNRVDPMHGFNDFLNGAPSPKQIPK